MGNQRTLLSICAGLMLLIAATAPADSKPKAKQKPADEQAAQPAQPSQPALKKLMTAREFKLTGLEKLTPVELMRLDDWIRRYAARTQKGGVAGKGAAAAAGAAGGELIQSKIEAGFDGWDGETIFRLDNGQVWQQAGEGQLIHSSYQPGVVIYKDGDDWKMKVDGVEETIEVKRVK